MLLSQIKVILQAKHIPDGAIVTKVAGEKQYTISSEVVFYGDAKTPGKPKVIVDPGVRFLVRGNVVNIIPDHRELVWLAVFDGTYSDRMR